MALKAKEEKQVQLGQGDIQVYQGLLVILVLEALAEYLVYLAFQEMKV